MCTYFSNTFVFFLVCVCVCVCVDTQHFASFVPLSSGKQRTGPMDEDVIVSAASDVITDEIVEEDAYHNLSAEGQPIKVASEAKVAKGPAADPSTLTPHAVVPSDTSMGVITVMGIECS